MIPNSNAAYGIYPIEVRIKEIVAKLHEAGCPAEDVCLLMSPSHPMAHSVRDAKVVPTTLNLDSPASELLQWLSRLGAVVIPGVAFFVGSRIFLQAVLAPCPTMIDSDSTERLIGLGLPTYEAVRYADRLTHDAVMIFVSCSDQAQSHWIREVLRQTGADEVSCLVDAVVPDYVERQARALQMTA
jgi:hypothetical protein